MCPDYVGLPLTDLHRRIHLCVYFDLYTVQGTLYSIQYGCNTHCLKCHV